jgi:DNA polymerase
MENAAIQAVQGKTATETHGIRFIYRPNILFMELPSKRRLAYIQPQIGINQFGSESITYMGLNAAKKWSRLETFGGKLVENCIQGIARDLLCHSMKTLSGCRIVAHVHDELIIEADESITLDYVSRKMAEVPDWAEGLQLRADGYECEFYQKN